MYTVSGKRQMKLKTRATSLLQRIPIYNNLSCTDLVLSYQLVLWREWHKPMEEGMSFPITNKKIKMVRKQRVHDF